MEERHILLGMSCGRSITAVDQFTRQIAGGECGRGQDNQHK